MLLLSLTSTLSSYKAHSISMLNLIYYRLHILLLGTRLTLRFLHFSYPLPALVALCALNVITAYALSIKITAY